MDDAVKTHRAKLDPEAVRPVTLSSAAIQHITKHISQRGQGAGIRLSVKTTGCSGYSYVLDFVDEPLADDYRFPINDTLTVFVAPQYIRYLQGTHIDFIKEGINEKFVFENPNAKGECGCGESFNI